ncbi:class I SAM-dependent methyltransferase [Candidatus Woesearchaeota archaeon]|nr:class I SAM-dependent methyltransferase [Candidatus Woesearchaeota archaeon]
MGKELKIVSAVHKSTKREYLPRMMDDKINCMVVAKKYGFDYWDGERKFGYGGYKYMPGRWAPVAQMLIDHYKLPKNAKILDVGCGKAFLLYELSLLLPEATIVGFDFSEYAIKNSKEEIRDKLFVHKAQDKYPFKDKEFDLVISLTTLHNLEVFDLKKALKEVERVGKNKFIVVESYRNEAELFNLECWALTAEAFFSPKAWEWLFKEFGYTGDYEFIYFE